MVQPDDPDRQERSEVGEVRRPAGGEGTEEVAVGNLDGVWNLEVEDEQRDGDRHHAVAERLDPGGRGEARRRLRSLVGVARGGSQTAASGLAA